MNKNYEKPIVKLNIIALEDIVMVSGNDDVVFSDNVFDLGGNVDREI